MGSHRRKPASVRKYTKKRKRRLPIRIPKYVRPAITQIPIQAMPSKQYPDMDDMINEFAENTLKKIRDYIESSGQSKALVPDIHINIPGGCVVLRDGFVEDLTSLRRKGNFKVEIEDDEFVITGWLEFTKLYANFNYTGKMCGIGPTGKINANVLGSTVHLKLYIKVDLKNKLKLKLTGYQVNVHLDQLDVGATGLSVAFNWLLSKIATQLANHHKPGINRVIEERMEEMLKKLMRGDFGRIEKAYS